MRKRIHITVKKRGEPGSQPNDLPHTNINTELPGFQIFI